MNLWGSLNEHSTTLKSQKRNEEHKRGVHPQNPRLGKTGAHYLKPGIYCG